MAYNPPYFLMTSPAKEIFTFETRQKRLALKSTIWKWQFLGLLYLDREIFEVEN